MTALVVRRLGRVEYADGLALQAHFAAARRAGTVDDTLLLLEHSPVITLGRGAEAHNVLLPERELHARGVELFATDRGGDVTYHGPGQIVGYPIFDLAPDRKDVRKYVRNLEEVLIRAAGDFGVIAERIDGRVGIWVRSPKDFAPHQRKIAAIGVHLSRWITTHGFAFNVAPDLGHFGFIVPCGIRDAGVTSLAAELVAAPSQRAVEDRLASHTAQVFGREVVEHAADVQSVLVAVLRRSSSGTEALLLRRTPARGGFWQTVTGRIEAGETPLDAAQREAFEETGFQNPVSDLGYAHSFVRMDRVVQETCFALWARPDAAVRMDPNEHDDQRWTSLAKAIEEISFAGMKRALRLAGETAAP